MPRSWPPLTVKEVCDCLKALGWVHDHDESTHQIWVNVKTHQIVPIDTKWSPVAGPMLKHIVTEQVRVPRETFYGATHATAKKIGLR